MTDTLLTMCKSIRAALNCNYSREAIEYEYGEALDDAIAQATTPPKRATVVDEETGERFVCDVRYDASSGRYHVTVGDWVERVDRSDVPGLLTARNVAIAAILQHDRKAKG